jgi:hypothetical protein
MELGAKMELWVGRGGLLGEEYPLYIVGERFQPLPPLTACAQRYYRTTSRYYRRTGRYYCYLMLYNRTNGSDTLKSYYTRQHVIEPPERYYRTPLRYYRMVVLNGHTE